MNRFLNNLDELRAAVPAGFVFAVMIALYAFCAGCTGSAEQPGDPNLAFASRAVERPIATSQGDLPPMVDALLSVRWTDDVLELTTTDGRVLQTVREWVEHVHSEGTGPDDPFVPFVLAGDDRGLYFSVIAQRSGEFERLEFSLVLDGSASGESRLTWYGSDRIVDHWSGRLW